MLNFPYDENEQYFMYDLIDYKANYWKGFGTGVITGGLTTFVLLAITGFYIAG